MIQIDIRVYKIKLLKILMIQIIGQVILFKFIDHIFDLKRYLK